MFPQKVSSLRRQSKQCIKCQSVQCMEISNSFECKKSEHSKRNASIYHILLAVNIDPHIPFSVRLRTLAAHAENIKSCQKASTKEHGQSLMYHQSPKTYPTCVPRSILILIH